jgi:ABC-type nitrate/sulfonate/bicarbonate transport system substrate-binding protein
MTAWLSRRRLTKSAIAIGGLGALGGRAHAADKIAYLTPFGYLMGFAPTLYAQVGGYFDKQGLEVDIEGGRGSAMAVQQVVAGNVLVSRTGGTDLIKAVLKEPSIIAFAEIVHSDIFSVISSAAKPIDNPAAMAGRTIGVVWGGGAPENFLDMMLAGAGVPRESVARQQVGNAPSAFELVKLGRIDAFIAASDTVFQLLQSHQPIIAWSTDRHAPAPGQVYIASRSAIDAQADALAGFLRGVQASIGAMLQAPDRAPILAAIEAHYTIAEAASPDKGLAVLNNNLETFYRPVYEDKFASSPERFEAPFALMQRAGIVGPATTPPMFYTDAIRKHAFG